MVLKSTSNWPSNKLIEVNPVRVRFICGFGDTGSSVPETTRQAILLLVADYYEHREQTMSGAVRAFPQGVDRLIDNDRFYGFV